MLRSVSARKEAWGGVGGDGGRTSLRGQREGAACPAAGKGAKLNLGLGTWGRSSEPWGLWLDQGNKKSHLVWPPESPRR